MHWPSGLLERTLEDPPLGGILTGRFPLWDFCTKDCAISPPHSLSSSLSLELMADSDICSSSSPPISALSGWLRRSWDKESSRVVTAGELELSRWCPSSVGGLTGGGEAPSPKDKDGVRLAESDPSGETICSLVAEVTAGKAGSESNLSPATPFLGISTVSRFILRLRPCSLRRYCTMFSKSATYRNPAMSISVLFLPLLKASSSSWLVLSSYCHQPLRPS